MVTTKQMKITNYKLLVVALVLLISVSCKKETETKVDVPSTPGKFSEIKTDPNFNWSTTREVEVKVLGLKTEMPIANTLVLSNKEKDANYYTGRHDMSESFTFKIVVPTRQDSMVLSFGSIQKTYGIQQASVEVDYIISYPEE